jgi:hypothetical protein
MTPVMTMRLVGSSMLNQKLSMDDIGSRFRLLDIFISLAEGKKVQFMIN